MNKKAVKKLKVFVCYATVDLVWAERILKWLKQFNWIKPWISTENILPGQNWELEIEESIENADTTLILLSKQAFKRRGDLYNLREIRKILDKALGLPDDDISFIPILIDGIDPKKYLKIRGKPLNKKHWVNLLKEDDRPTNLENLQRTLELVAIEKLKIKVKTLYEQDLASGNPERFDDAVKRIHEEKDKDGDLHRFFRNTLFNIARKSENEMPARFMAAHQLDVELAEPFAYGRELREFMGLGIYKVLPIPNDLLHISKYPITNIQYQRFLTADNFANEKYWQDLPDLIDLRYRKSWAWLQNNKLVPTLEPRNWDEPQFGVLCHGFPVVGITIYEAMAYCNWLKDNWEGSEEQKSNPGLKPINIRLPTEEEWLLAAGKGNGRKDSDFPWGEDALPSHANVKESAIIKTGHPGQTTPVWMFPDGASPLGVCDMAGNVLEWTMTVVPGTNDQFILHGGCWNYSIEDARLSKKFPYYPWRANHAIGFRLVVETE